jgi:hypothetical protein
MGIHTPNTSGYPIIEIPLASYDELDELGRYLFEHGQYATLAAYPLVPKNEVGFRIQVTAANTDEQIDELIEVLHSLHDHFQLEQVVEHVPPAAGGWPSATPDPEAVAPLPRA